MRTLLLKPSKRLRFKDAIMGLTGLQVYYPLTEISGTSAKNYAVKNRGSLSGIVVNTDIGKSGRRGKSYYFDGSNDKITFTGLTLSTTAFSLGFLVKVNGNQDTSDRVFDYSDTGPSGGLEISFGNSSSLNAIWRNAGTTQASISSGSLPLREFQFLIVTYEENSAKLYLNGILIGTDTSVTMTAPSSADPTLGGRAVSAANFSTVWMQHFFVTNTILSQATVTKLSNIVGIKFPKMHTFYENFDFGGIDSGKWTDWSSGKIVGNSDLVLAATSTTNAAYYGWNSTEYYDLTDSYAFSQVVDAGNQSITSFELYPVHLSNGSDAVSIMITGNTVYARKKLSGTSSTVGSSIAYNSSTMVYFRIRESGGTTYWEYATTPTGAWTQIASAANPIAVTRLQAEVVIGTWQAEVSTTTAKVDNFNFVPNSYEFSWQGYTWQKRTHYGARSNNQKWTPDNIVEPDANNYINFNLTNSGLADPIGAEIYTTQRGFGYGTYMVEVATRLDNVHAGASFGGVFTFDFTNPPAYREIDMDEIRHYGTFTNKQILYNHTWNNNGTNTFITNNTDIVSDVVQTHKMVWGTSQITFNSYIGSGTTGSNFFSGTHGSQIPTPGSERVHINTWNNTGVAGYLEATPLTVTVRNFTFNAL